MGELLKPNPGPPTTLHIDLNSAFATICQQDYPELRNLPLVIAVHETATLISASHQAKALGIKVGMKVFQARQLAPNLLFRPPDPKRYREVNAQLLTILDRYTPDVLPLSIDEAALDLAHTPCLEKNSPEDVGREIKKCIRDEIGDLLTCSIGISTNRYLAKIASLLQKPNGLERIDASNLNSQLARLHLTDLTGISTATEKKLNAAGIFTPIELLDTSAQRLSLEVFGTIVGQAWYLRLRGYEVDFRSSSRQSFSHSYVLPNPSDNRKELEKILLKLCEHITHRLHSASYQAGSLTLQLHERTGREFTCSGPIRHRQLFTARLLFTLAKTLLHQAPQTFLVGTMAISLTGLQAAKTGQVEMFDEAKESKLAQALDIIYEKFGENALRPASLLSEKKGSG